MSQTLVSSTIQVYSSPMQSTIQKQILWPLGCTITLAIASVSLWALALEQTRTHIASLTDIKNNLNKHVERLENQQFLTHQQTIQWLSQAAAMHEPRAHIKTIQQQYLRKMTAEITALNKRISLHARSAQPHQWPTTKLSTQLQRLSYHIDRFSNQLFLTDSAPVEYISGLSHPNNAVFFALQRLKVTISYAIDTTQRPSNISTWAIVSSLLFLSWLPLGIWLILRHSQHIQRRALYPTHPAPAHSYEEHLFVQHHQTAAKRQKEYERKIDDSRRTQDRTVQLKRRTEHELASLKRYNENLVNSLRTAIIVTNASGEITNFNRPARHMLNLNNNHIGSKITTHPLYSAVQQRNQSINATIQGDLVTQQTLQFEAIPYRLAKTEKIIDLSIVTYQDESDRARGWLWIADDVTTAVRTKEQLIATEHMATVGRIAAQVAHEIRNPLSAIALNTELLQEDYDPSSPTTQYNEARELLHGISKEIERLTDITESYLELARLPQPDLRKTDINQLISGLLAMLNEEMRSNEIDVDFKLANQLPTVAVDPGQIRQAMLNVLRNSREAIGHDGGQIQIITHATDEHCLLEITDTGNGIPETVRKRIFEPFFTTKEDGTGLGLSLTHQIIQDHGGHIKIIPSAPRGTQVSIALPLNRRSI